MGAHPWPDGQFERVVALSEKGFSASQIAAEVGNGLTRSAVIGRLFRAGLPCGGSSKAAGGRMRSRPPKKNGFSGLNIQRRAKAKKTDPGFTEPKPEPIIDFGSPIGPRINLLLLNDSRCRWPIGDPLSDSFAYCGHKTKSQSIYCQHHHGRAFTPTPRMREPVPAAGGYVCQPLGAGSDYQHNSLKPLSF